MVSEETSFFGRSTFIAMPGLSDLLFPHLTIRQW